MPIAQMLVVAIRLLVRSRSCAGRWRVPSRRWRWTPSMSSLVDVFARALGEPSEFGPVYAQLDKVLDTYYLTIELYVAWRWRERLLRGTAAVLYAWRLVGAILFELTAFHPLLLVFPNLFENFFFYVLITQEVRDAARASDTAAARGRPVRSPAAEAGPGVAPALRGSAPLAMDPGPGHQAATGG